MFLNKMIPNVNVLSTRIANRVMSKHNTTLIISIDNCSSNLRKVKLFKQCVKPDSFLHNTIYSASTEEVATVGCFFKD